MNALERMLHGRDEPHEFDPALSSPVAALDAELFWLRWWTEQLEQALLDADAAGIRYCRSRIRELVRDACTAGERAARWEPALATHIGDTQRQLW